MQRRTNLFTRTIAVSALLAISGLPVAAYAGEADRARAAIAEAKGKIEAGDKVSSEGEAADLQGRAHAAFQSAQNNLSKGRKGEAISDAQHAGEFADMAIVSADKHKTAVARNGRLDAEASVSAAQQSAAEANDRANNAQQVAATATAQADALRNAPPAPTTTTVATVEKQVVRTPVSTVHHTKHVVTKKPVQTTADKTTTTVTTTQP